MGVRDARYAAFEIQKVRERLLFKCSIVIIKKIAVKWLAIRFSKFYQNTDFGLLMGIVLERTDSIDVNTHWAPDW